MQAARAQLLRPAVRRLSTQVLRPAPRALAAAHNHRRPPPPPDPPHGSARPLFLASALAAATLSSPALADDAPRQSLQWPQVLRELRHAQQHLGLPAGFVAERRRSSAAGEWAFSLDFPVAAGADLYAVLVTLAAALQPAEVPPAAVHVDETPTRTVFKVAAPDVFEVAVSVPRLTPFDTRVVVEVTKPDGPDAAFSADEVDALVRAYFLMQTSQGVSAQIPMNGRGLLDGEDSVDIGPPTVIDRSRNHNRAQGGGRPLPYGEFPVEGIPRVGGSDQNADLAAKRARAKLEELGVDVFDGKDSTLTWDALAGYDDVKKRIENTLTLPLRHPDVYENIVRGTRKRFESNLPKAVLYEGPPGCGKTLSAKILSVSIGVPFVHVPLETILSKFYGETTRKLAEILQTANDLGPCLVFIDECDSIGLSRSSTTDVHEVTRRTLSVLLRHIDGLDGPQNTILLAATNHKEDIDPALMSRFDVVVSFPLPDLETRAAVLALYAKHLSEDELKTIAELSGGFSGRELLDVCEEAERTYAGYIVREAVSGNKLDDGEMSDMLPRLSEYVDAIERKAPHVVGRNQRQNARGMDPAGQPMTVGPAPTLAM